MSVFLFFLLLFAITAGVLALAIFPIIFDRQDNQQGWILCLILVAVGVGPMIFELSYVRVSFYSAFQPPPTAIGSLAIRAVLLLQVATLAIALFYVVSRKRPVATGRGWNRLPAGLAAFSGAVVVASLLGTKPSPSFGVLLLPTLALLAAFLPRPPISTVIVVCQRILRLYVAGSLISLVISPEWAVNGLSRYHLFGLEERLVGLTPHGNTLGFLAAVLIVLAFKNRRYFALDLGSGLVVLLLSESRTSAIGLVIALLVMWRFQAASKRPPQQRIVGAIAWGVIGVAVVVAGFSVGGPERLSESTEGFNGRTMVWRLTLDEWSNNPVFGYGPTIWDASYREERLGTALTFVGQAHNQFVQTLGDSGLVGLMGLVVYGYALAKTAWMAPDRFRCLTLAMVLLIFTRGMSEAPFRNSGFDAALFAHFSVFCLVLAAAAASTELAGVGRGSSSQVFRTKEQPLVVDAVAR